MYCQIAGEEAEILHSRHKAGGFPGSSVVKKKKTLLPMQETQARSQVWEDILEKEMATHSSTLAWRIPWREEPGGLQSMASQRVGHD